ncbi:MAG: ImmA/IrrE family metallo-endopeptidase [Lachnospiraceae bacterium]|nr:ImmA/IrrE family metallo-endopeptidase [Lachnospiraceae bacterium]
MKSAQELNSLALHTRQMWGEDSYSPIDIFAIVNGWKEKKITLVKYPLSERISGICTKVDDDIVICINSTTSYGRQRFTLAHELYHVLYEPETQQVICDMNMNIDKPESEREADKFAGYLLMPYDALLQYKAGKPDWNLKTIIDAEQFFRISHQAMIYRLTFDNLITDAEADKYKAITVSTEAARLGYGKELYYPADRDKPYFTTGEYIRKVEQMAEKNIISNGKKEELLLDAYRPDIVYNYDEEEANLND